jgi:endo-1,4-beta-xylanase
VCLGAVFARADGPGCRGDAASCSLQCLTPYFELGVALPHVALREEEKQLVRRHFGAITPENALKPARLQPREGQWDFAPADALVDWAATHGLAVHGHTLVWHQQCPDWFFRDGDAPATRERVLDRLRTHIATVVGRYAGRVRTWDVVNEAIDDGDGFLRATPWTERTGDAFLVEAFLAARRADPRALLVYNDYNIERGAKRDKTLRLIRLLRTRGAPIDGVGIQGHWSLDDLPLPELREALRLFHAEGLRVFLTELDLDVVPGRLAGADLAATGGRSEDPFAAGLPPEVQQRLAARYGELFTLLLAEHQRLERVTFWGLHDGRSWLNGWPWRRTNHPLLWDRQCRPKPAYDAVLAAAHAQRRETSPAGADALPGGPR